MVLSAASGRDERAVSAWPGEDDVARLVTDQQRANDARGLSRDVDHAHAVREQIDDPDLVVVARGDCDGIQTDRHGARGRQTAVRPDVEDLESAIRHVRREQPGAIGRERERSRRNRFEVDVRTALRERAGRRSKNCGGGERASP
jgi:hypothetical protein